MNATEVQAAYRPAEVVTSDTFEGVAIMESVSALATIALAIVGLAGEFSITMAAIATIVLGAAIWIEGGSYAATHRAAGVTEGRATLTTEWSEGLAAEFLGGLAGIVLGVLALLGIAPLTLLSIGSLVLGATFLFGGMTTICSSSRALMGLCALVLGLLAVVGLSPVILVLAALACLGASALLRGAVTSARLELASHK
jgi:hypothetical protein